MFESLLSRLPGRVSFVVGKGGVGKTTTAGALALAFADRGEKTHLISTDPAHSLTDLFPQPCSELLTIEEFNATTYAETFVARLRPPFIELIENGTYLDARDAAGFLDLSIPGIDEVMAALRLVDVAHADAQHIVVDTAPTGHTLRLLDSGDVIDSWVKAGQAMAAKAGAVAEALVGGRVRFEAERLLDEWHASALHFQNDIVRTANTVLVTRAGEVIAAETSRLREELTRRQVHVAVELAVGDPTSSADFVVDRFADATGCKGLRAWREHVQAAHSHTHAVHSHTPPHTHPHSHSHAVTDLLKKLPKTIWLSGKGGVGKSTCASALAATLSEERTVCLVSTDPAGSLSEVLGRDVKSEPTRIENRFYARQIDATAEFNRMRGQYYAQVNEIFGALGLENSAQLDRRVIESLWDLAPPGIDEIMSLIEIVEHAGDYDVLVIDSAPTGHFLRLLALPEIALDWVHALLRLLVKYGAVASLDALAQDLLAFAKRLRQLKLDLSSPAATAVFVVTLTEDMVRAETARLSDALERAGIPLAATILNRADDGSRDHDVLAGRGVVIRAPDNAGEVVGTTALRSFVASWDLIRE